jgi:hypothetical protein
MCDCANRKRLGFVSVDEHTADFGEQFCRICPKAFDKAFKKVTAKPSKKSQKVTAA